MILVTGGAGYIGSHTVKALKASGLSPVIFDNFSTGHRSFIKGTPAFEGDVCNSSDLEQVFGEYSIDGVLHFAGKALVAESAEMPESYYQTNLIGGLNLLGAMKKCGVRFLIFSSTCATYGVPERVPIPEDHPQNPINPYGETKLAFERAMRWFHKAHGLEYLSLRYFNAAGADADGEFGEDHNPETHLIPLALQAAIGHRAEVQIFGTDYPTPDGTCIRDYIHVSDLARAHVAGLQVLMEGRVQSQALNLGTGGGYSVREVIESVRRITGRDFAVRETARRPGDPPQLVASVNRAKDLLGWTAVESDLDKIVASAWKWLQRTPSP
ncbi:MAG: UDP-glucose 4-epimerase GalE [Acidobacteria bacterium]|nr:MAG: UDP-glucose 4-epimerase GalE [Acidobacteriota bacterium]